MKNQNFHIYFFGLLGLASVVACFLLFGSESVVASEPVAQYEQCRVVEAEVDHAVLDTTHFFETSCYRFCRSEEPNSQSPVSEKLSKTVIKIENAAGQFEDIEKSNIKLLPPNASLNLMIEKYTVERRMKNKNEMFFVTVESFNTQVEKLNLSQFRLNTIPSGEASLTEDQMEFIRSYCAGEMITKVCENGSRPL